MVHSKNFISKDEMHKNVYRFISFDSLIEIIVKEQLALVKTLRWDDPFENYFFNCEVYDRNIIMNYNEIATRMYGQCWSLTSESDALWRIYFNDKRGVRIQNKFIQIIPYS